VARLHNIVPWCILTLGWRLCSYIYSASSVAGCGSSILIVRSFSYIAGSSLCFPMAWYSLGVYRIDVDIGSFTNVLVSDASGSLCFCIAWDFVWIPLAGREVCSSNSVFASDVVVWPLCLSITGDLLRVIGADLDACSFTKVFEPSDASGLLLPL